MRRIGLLVLTLGVMLPACRAEDTVKQGVEGEFCNGEADDCRAGHACVNYRCQSLNGGSVTCGVMCARLQSCNAAESDCEASCQLTFEGLCEGLPCPWSEAAIEAFGTCIVDELTCAEAQDGNAPQTCYSRIPLDIDRKARCDAFLGAADRCSTSDREELRQSCYRLARTAPESSWVRTDGCVERIASGVCDEAIRCLNTVFELSPILQADTEEL